MGSIVQRTGCVVKPWSALDIFQLRILSGVLLVGLYSPLLRFLVRARTAR